MPNAQVFGPTTVNPGYTSTGEKTLLTMATSLPAGGKNIIFATALSPTTSDVTCQGTFRIKKGTTILYETPITQNLIERAAGGKPILLIAIDSSPSGNDVYTFTVNVTTAASSSITIHVQGMVVKASTNAGWTYNTTGVSISNGATATVASLSTSFPSNSKIAIVAVATANTSQASSIFVSGGNVRLKSGTTVVSSNQFKTGMYGGTQPLWVHLSYFHTASSSSQTYSVEIQNDSGYTITAYANIVAFRVDNGAFLDTGSVALTSGSQVTVGNLSTTLSGDVAVIALVAEENTSSSDVTAFNANDIVLQLNNSTTGQIANLLSWYIRPDSSAGRSGTLPLFRFDTGVSSPSYQVKMTARASRFNGEAKILAFIPVVAVQYTKELLESMSLVDTRVVKPGLVRGEVLSLVDTLVSLKVFLRVLEEVLSLSDMVSKLMATACSESVVMADNVAKSVGNVRSEALALVDSAVKRVEAIRSESLVLSDIISKLMATTHSESVAMADSVAKSISSTKSEVLSLVDLVVKMPGVVRSEVLVLSDVLVRSVFKVLQDVMSLLDYYSRVWHSHLTLEESLALSDLLTAVRTKLLSLSEVLSLVDEKFISVGKSLMEVTGLSDALAKSITRSLVELVGLIDMAIRHVSIVRSEIIDIIDTFEKKVSKELIETIKAEDVLQALRTFLRVLTEALSLVDTLVHDWLYIEGGVRIGDDIIGDYSISYKDFIREGLPIQTLRHKVMDYIYVGDDRVGGLTIEWDDKVSDIVDGVRMLYVLSSVELVDEWEVS